MSRCGFLVSSAVEETASNPMKAKKDNRAPLIMPPMPSGQKDANWSGESGKAQRDHENPTATFEYMTLLYVRFSRIP